jgi:hypothetical protein
VIPALLWIDTPPPTPLSDAVGWGLLVVTTKSVLVAVRLEVSVTVTWKVTVLFVHAVESYWNAAVARLEP